MADTAVAITAGSGTNIDTRTEGTNGNHRQVVVLGDPATNAGVAAVDATAGLSVNVTNASLTVGSHAVTNAGTFAVQDSRFVTEDAAAASDPVGPHMMAVRRDTLSASEVSADGDVVALKATNKGQLHVLAAIDSTQLSTLQTSAQAMATGYQLVAPANNSPTFVADDAAFTPGTTIVQMAGFQADEASTDSVDEGDGGAARMTLDRKVIVNPQPHTAGGLTVFKSLDLDETEEDIKTAAGQVYGFYAINRTTSPLYLRFYNATAANVTVGTTGHLLGPIEIPANASDHTALMWTFGGMGIPFDTAISAAVTTGFADNDTGAPAANACIVNVLYK